MWGRPGERLVDRRLFGRVDQLVFVRIGPCRAAHRNRAGFAPCWQQRPPGLVATPLKKIAFGSFPVIRADQRSTRSAPLPRRRTRRGRIGSRSRPGSTRRAPHQLMLLNTGPACPNMMCPCKFSVTALAYCAPGRRHLGISDSEGSNEHRSGMGYGVMAYAVGVEVLRAPSAFTSEPQQFFDWMLPQPRSASEPVAYETARSKSCSTPDHILAPTDRCTATRCRNCASDSAGPPQRLLVPRRPDLVRHGSHRARRDRRAVRPQRIRQGGLPGAAAGDHRLPGHRPPHPHRAEAARPSTQRRGPFRPRPVLADRRVAQSVAEMRDWIQFCAEADRDLVTFYT